MTPPDSAQFPAGPSSDALQSHAVIAHALSQRVATADGTLAILSEVELAVKAGETLAITGASGSGKSTLLGLLAGLDQPSSGEIFLLGQRLGDLDEDARARLRAGRIGFVFQSFQLLPALTALENILLPLELPAATRLSLRCRAARDARPTGSTVSDWPRAPRTRRASCQAASSSASPSRAPSPPIPKSCSPTSPPATSTPTPARASSNSCSNSTPPPAPP